MFGIDQSQPNSAMSIFIEFFGLSNNEYSEIGDLDKFIIELQFDAVFQAEFIKRVNKL